MDEIDPKIKRFVVALGKTETGDRPDAYSARGASGEIGRYQFMPDTYKAYARKYLGDENADTSNENQNKIAYSFVKEKKDAGYNPAQIASMWNAGEDEPDAYTGTFKNGKASIGKNSKGVDYSVPDYVKRFSSIYQGMSGQPSTDTSTNSDTLQNQPTDTTQSPQSHDDLLNNSITRGIQSFFPGKQVGESIGTLTGYALTAIKEKLGMVPKGTTEQYDLSAPTPLQTVADVGQGALMVGGGELAGGGKLAATTSGRIAQAAIGGGLYGGLGAVSGGSTDVGEIGKEAAIGGVLGAATGGIIEGAGAAFKGIKNSLSIKTAEEIEALARKPGITQKEINKLSTSEQKEFYNAKRKIIDEEELGAKASRDAFVEQESARINKENADLKTKLDTEKDITAQNIKEPARQALKDNSELYMQKVEESFSDGKNFDTKISSAKLEQAIEDVIPDKVQQDLAKKQFGLEELTTTNPQTGNITYKDTTLGDIWKKSKELRSSLSKSAVNGGRTYSQDEFNTVRNTKILTDVLEKQGMDLSAANEFWSKWAKLRNRIVTEVKPFDVEAYQKTPIANTLERASNPLVKGHTDALRFVSNLEKEFGLQEGTLTSDVKDIINKIDENKLTKANISKIKTKLTAELKANKLRSIDKLDKEQFNTGEIKKRQALIRKVIIGVVGLAGASEAKKYIGAIL